MTQINLFLSEPLIGAISQNISVASNILESEDVLSAINCLKKLGVKIKKKNQKIHDLWKRFGITAFKKEW